MLSEPAAVVRRVIQLVRDFHCSLVLRIQETQLLFSILVSAQLALLFRGPSQIHLFPLCLHFVCLPVVS